MENKTARRQGNVQTAWTSRDFKKARRDLNLSVTELARILNSNIRTVRLWEQEAEDMQENES